MAPLEVRLSVCLRLCCSPSGHYCPPASARPVECARGFYQPESGAAECRECRVGQDSVVGSRQCTVCSTGYYRPHADSLATECTTCDVIPGVRCGSNATIATLNLTAGYWRHSRRTLQALRCKSDGGWSPCQGGADLGGDGDGYCMPGHRGPRCELCDGPEYSRYFGKLDLHCHECGDVSAKASILFSILFVVCLAAAGFGATLLKRTRHSRVAIAIRGNLVKAVKTYRKSGMRYKGKALIGFYQCVAAFPKVFDVKTPTDLPAGYNRLVDVLELPAELLGLDLIIPASCFGEYRSRLLFAATWPVILLVSIAACLVGSESVRELRQRNPALIAPRSTAAVVSAGFRQALPLTLLVTFLLVPATSTRVFKTFLCDPIEYGDGEKRRYLVDDLELECDTEEYTHARDTAIVIILIWPVGVPLLYFLLLWASRDALVSGVPTALSRSTAFLSADYKTKAWW